MIEKLAAAVSVVRCPGINLNRLDRLPAAPRPEVIMRLMPEVKPPRPDIGAAVAFLKKLMIEDLWNRNQDR